MGGWSNAWPERAASNAPKIGGVEKIELKGTRNKRRSKNYEKQRPDSQMKRMSRDLGTQSARGFHHPQKREIPAEALVRKEVHKTINAAPPKGGKTSFERQWRDRSLDEQGLTPRVKVPRKKRVLSGEKKKSNLEKRKYLIVSTQVGELLAIPWNNRPGKPPVNHTSGKRGAALERAIPSPKRTVGGGNGRNSQKNRRLA